MVLVLVPDGRVGLPNFARHFHMCLQLEGNPCTRTEADQAAVKAAVLAHIPQLRHLDRPLDGDSDSEDGDEKDSEEEENAGQGKGGEREGLSQELGHSIDGLAALKLADGALTSPTARGQASNGESVMRNEGVAGGLHAWREYDAEGGRLITTALDMLDELERACMDASAGVVRASVRASREKAAALRASADARLGALPVAQRPGSALIGVRPGSASAGSSAAAASSASGTVGAAARPGSASNLAGAGAGAGLSSGGLARQASGSSSLRAMSPSPVLGTGMARPLSGSALPSSPAPLAATQRPGSSGRLQLDPPLVTAGYAAGAKGQANSPQLSRASSLQGKAGGQLAPVRAPSPSGLNRQAGYLADGGVSMPHGPSLAMLGARAVSPLPPTHSALTGALAPGSSVGLGASPAVGLARGPVAVSVSGSDRVEAQVAADLAMLRSRLQGLVEPMAAAAAVAASVAEIGRGSSGSSSAAGGRPASGASAGRGGGRPSSGHPGSATAATARRGAAPAASAASASARVTAATAATATVQPSDAATAVGADGGAVPLVTNDPVMAASRAGLHAEMDRLMGSAASRVRAQRESDTQLSSDIRALRSSTSVMSQLKGALSLKTALSAGPGAVGAVRAAIARDGVHAGAGGFGDAGGVVSGALSRHAAGRVVGDGGMDQVRASLQHLQQLSTALMQEHGAAVEAAIGVVSGAPPTAAVAEVGQGGSSGASTSKYQAMLAARLAARAGLGDVEEGEEEEEEGEEKVGGGATGDGAAWEDDDDEDAAEEEEEEEPQGLHGLFNGPALPPDPFKVQ